MFSGCRGYCEEGDILLLKLNVKCRVGCAVSTADGSLGVDQLANVSF